MDAFGISAAVVTPFDADGAVNLIALRTHVETVLSNGADSVTLFGTTGEGASLGASERLNCLDAVADLEIAHNKVVVSLCATSIEDALAQARGAADRGVTDLLVPPPFYFRSVAEAAVHEWYDALLTGLSAGTRIIPYHFPQMTGVPLPPDFIWRLRDTHPERVIAVKDSSGDWANTKSLLDEGGIAVLVGDERHLAKAARLGCAGSISGLANVVSQRLKTLLDTGIDDAAIDTLVDAVVALTATPAVKVLVSEVYRDPAWRRVRPPLTPIPEVAIPALQSALAAVTAPEVA